MLTHVKIGSGEGTGLFREAETDLWAVVWSWGVSWDQIIQGLGEQGHRVWTNVGRRQESQDLASRPRPL